MSLEAVLGRQLLHYTYFACSRMCRRLSSTEIGPRWQAYSLKLIWKKCLQFRFTRTPMDVIPCSLVYICKLSEGIRHRLQQNTNMSSFCFSPVRSYFILFQWEYLQEYCADTSAIIRCTSYYCSAQQSSLYQRHQMQYTLLRFYA
jgi:hypothetical protein